MQTWTNDGLTFAEIIQQPYTNCLFAAGIVEGHPVDTLYIRWERGDEGGMLCLRPDEAAAIVRLLGGVLWSTLVEDIPENDHVAI